MSNQLISKEAMKAVVPTHLTSAITDDLIDTINALDDPIFAEEYANNLLGFTQVLTKGKYKMSDYFAAVKFVSYKAMKHNNKTAYIATFPERYEKLVLDNRTEKEISAYVSAYANNKLVALVSAQALIPVHIANNWAFQEAVNKQVSIMRNEDASLRVQSDAADSLMKHLKPPEESKIEIEIGVKQTSVLDQLREATAQMVQAQVKDIESGNRTAKDIAGSGIGVKSANVFEGEVVIESEDIEMVDEVEYQEPTPKRKRIF